MYLKSFINCYILNGFDFYEAKSEIDFVLDILFSYSYKDFILGKKLEDWQIKKAQNIFKERTETKKPIQQIVGKTFFYTRVFHVNEYTLIPRPETELVVKEVLKRLKNQREVIDIGTGTGCIGITLSLENPLIKATLLDIECRVLEIAKMNADLYNLKNIDFLQSNLFEKVNKKYDVIVSNPPYIPFKEKNNLQREVKDFEPAKALFTKDNEGLEFYEKIINQAENYLNNNGLIVFELGISQAEKVKKMLEEKNFININIIKDYNSIDRVISGELNH